MLVKVYNTCLITLKGWWIEPADGPVVGSDACFTVLDDYRDLMRRVPFRLRVSLVGSMHFLGNFYTPPVDAVRFDLFIKTHFCGLHNQLTQTRTAYMGQRKNENCSLYNEHCYGQCTPFFMHQV